MKKIKLFHFDITTRGNYGDNLLFPMVRETFEAANDGEMFEVIGHASLRVQPSLNMIDFINESADAVVLGGGGLFLRDTNENNLSGWQWKIDQIRLSKIKIPLVLFAVGYNRFIGQREFAPKFAPHLRQTFDQSVFFGLRNFGSIDRVKRYLPDTYADAIKYQPCPTTLTGELVPSIATAPNEEKTIAAQMVVGGRQSAAGFDGDEILEKSVNVLKDLKSNGWTIVSTPFARADESFATKIESLPGLVDERIQLYGTGTELFDGVRAFSKIPFILGSRGHAQMVPFGTGAIPFSVHIHNKLKYFASDIDHEDFVIDPQTRSYVEDAISLIEEVHANFDKVQQSLLDSRTQMKETTERNLSEIYFRLTGRHIRVNLIPLRPRGVSKASFAFHDSAVAAAAGERETRSQEQIRVLEDELSIERENRKSAEERADQLVHEANSQHEEPMS